MNNVLPAATATTWRPSIANEMGVAWLSPPSPARHSSRPVAASRAKTTPADVEDEAAGARQNAAVGDIQIRLLLLGRDVPHRVAPAASSAFTTLTAGSAAAELPT